MTGDPGHGDVAVTATQRYARGTAIGAVAVAGSWHVGNNLFCTVTGWSQYRWPVLVVVAWLTVAVCTVVGSVNMLSRHGRRRLDVPLLGIPVLLLCVVAVLVSSRTDQVISNANWGLDSFGWYALVLLWRWPPHWLVAALAANWVLNFAVAWVTGPFDRVEISRYVIVMYVSGALQLGVALGARALQRTAERAARASADQAELAAARLTAEHLHADRQRRYREIGQTVRELLGGLADRSLDPTDPAVQRRCAVEASRLRRLIAEHDDVPSPLLHELRACADVAERRNVEVALETAGAVPELPRQVRRALTEAPMHLLAGARTHARVTVFSDADEVEVSVVADAAELVGAGVGGGGGPVVRDATSGNIDVVWSREGDTPWVRARWTGR